MLSSPLLMIEASNTLYMCCETFHKLILMPQYHDLFKIAYYKESAHCTNNVIKAHKQSN